MNLHATSCAICGPGVASTELFPAKFSEEDYNAAVFSARRLPDGVHYRIVKCNQCGLLRSDPVADEDVINQLYSESTFDYGGEVDGLKQTYIRYARIAAPQAKSVLEIGCGTGFFLEAALDNGFIEVAGVEPGKQVVAMASDRVRDKIAVDIMRPGLFSSKFDLVCLFQVFDHLSDPLGILKECKALLSNGGRILLLNHNTDALSAKILGEKSPIFDIEHTYLYSPSTIAKILEKAGFKVVKQGSVRNTYSLAYLTRLVPGLRKVSPKLPRGLAGLQLTVPLGNLYAVGEVVD